MSNDKIFENKVKAVLDISELSIDADTRNRLANMRARSLNASPHHASPSRWLTLANWELKSWMLGIFLAFSVLFVMLTMFNTKIQPVATHPQDQVVMLELLNDVEDLETVADSDFYLWADEVLAESAGSDAV